MKSPQTADGNQVEPEPVSVGIPAFNAEKFLQRAVTSVQNQNWPIADILVVDDGSSDRTAQLADGLGCTVVRHEKNRGDAAARNTVLANVRTPLLAWLDADDEWLPHHLRSVVPVLLRAPTSAAAFGLTRSHPSQALWPKPAHSQAGESLLAEALLRCLLPQNALVVRCSAIAEVGGYREHLRVASDYDLWCRLARRYDLQVVDNVTAIIHEHAAQSSKKGRQYTTTEYEIRREYLKVPVLQHQLGVSSEWLLEVFHAVWKSHLDVSWHSRDASSLMFHLGQFRQHATLLQLIFAVAKATLLPAAILRDILRELKRRPSAERARLT